MADDRLPSFYDTRVEACASCGETCEHHVRVEIVEEAETYGGRQPYRFAECQLCGHESRERVGVGG